MMYWLMKSDPESFSVDDLAKSRDETTSWDGVRNYQARNYMREMKKGDMIFFYHSSSDPTGIVGIATVVKEAYPDLTALDPKDDHYDPKSTPANPRWEMVDIRLVKRFERTITLDELKREKGLHKMELLRKGSRLSVQPVSAEEWKIVTKMSETKIRKSK